MKIPGFILAFYLALLSVVPCCAFDECPDDKAPTEQASHQNGDEDCGTCSPFFNCTGCACVSIHPESSILVVCSLQEKKTYTGFINSFPVNVQYDVWQPPKLG